MDLEGCATILDVGCGPGLLSVPIAARVKQVHALDYSKGMLDGLHAAIRDALNDPAVKPKLLEVGFEIVASTPEQFAAFQAADGVTR